MILPALAPNHEMRVKGRRGYHAENLTGSGLNGYNSPDLMLQQSLSQHLQFNINSQRQILAGYGRTVQFPIHIVPLNTSVSVTKQYLHSLFATKIFFVRFFNPLLPDVVTANIVIIVLDILLGDLTDIPQGMSGRIIGILPDCTALDIKAGKFE